MNINKITTSIRTHHWRGLAVAGVLLGCAGVAQAEPMSIGKVDISGYLDMSMSNTSVDGGESDSRGALDTAEVRFFSQLDDRVSISAHVAGGSDKDYELEQASVNFQATDEVSVFAGKYLSALGWEAYHAPDLFQWSTSVALTYPAFFNGVGTKYKNDSFEVYGSVASNIWDGSDTDADNVGYETAFRFTGIENFTLFAGMAKSEEGTDPTTDYEKTLVNVWASYKIGNLLLAAESNDLSDWGGEGIDGDSWLVMGNYAFTDKFSVTLRTSAIEVDDGTDLEKYTIAGLYSLTKNVSLVTEYNSVTDNSTDTDTDQVALEMIVVF